ncbi:hypothetical protein HZF24_13235 [Sedimentibacter hydroxybenzoicus DSM 7310]|uniref:Uncharacterized protein n=1 Tax=Sedimentibacter hydroxybenzoicus DSM 7310 TaxID=1123245 RepID=A0A974BLN0_SEDHY|nr:hypothetical protein [Sedimentibacter hydroxybenzoicus]NYB75106.1 hypothetical protein [Sedimentibacter hydroxybenzoicus DSM 7310]
MKKYSNYIIITLIIVNVFSIFKISSLERTMDNYYLQIVSGINRNNSEISNIYSNINSILEKQSSLLDSYKIEFGESLNEESLTVPVKITVVPKEYSEGLTVNIQLNDESFTLIKKGTSFEATIDADIFETFQPKVVISQDGIQKTESLEEYYDLYNKFLLKVEGYHNGSTQYINGKHIYKGGRFEFRITNINDNMPEKMSIVYDINGSILREDEVDISQIDDEDETTNYIYKDIIDEVKLGANEVLMVYANIQDKYGINYKYVVLRDEVDANGEPVFRRPEWSSGGILEITRNGKAFNVPDYRY